MGAFVVAGRPCWPPISVSMVSISLSLMLLALAVVGGIVEINSTSVDVSGVELSGSSSRSFESVAEIRNVSVLDDFAASVGTKLSWPLLVTSPSLLASIDWLAVGDNKRPDRDRDIGRRRRADVSSFVNLELADGSVIGIHPAGWHSSKLVPVNLTWLVLVAQERRANEPIRGFRQQLSSAFDDLLVIGGIISYFKFEAIIS